jgi:peptidylprolyl isomerase
MRLTMTAVAAFAILASCTTKPAAAPEAETSARYTFWRPAPVQNATEPSEVVKNSNAADWRAVDPQNLLIMELANGARVAIELATDFAPIHVPTSSAGPRGWWNPSSVYRVQENYVVQWGLNESDKPMPAGVVKAPPAEYERALAGLNIRPLGFPDSYAPMVGHANGWPVAYDPERGQAWLTHCYATVGVGARPGARYRHGGRALRGHRPRAAPS